MYNDDGDNMDFLPALGIKVKDKKLLERALTHSSYANEMKTECYERLEFLGDAVLQLAMSEYFYLNTNLKEGDMSKIRASYVCENALYEYAKEIELNKYIKVGHGEQKAGGQSRKVIMADVFEVVPLIRL